MGDDVATGVFENYVGYSAIWAQVECAHLKELVLFAKLLVPQTARIPVTPSLNLRLVTSPYAGKTTYARQTFASKSLTDLTRRLGML